MWRAKVKLVAQHITRLAGRSKIEDAIGRGVALRVDLVFCFGTDKAKLWGTPHTFVPDKDNLEKLVLDELKKCGFISGDDSRVSCGHVHKLWLPKAEEGVAVTIRESPAYSFVEPTLAAMLQLQYKESHENLPKRSFLLSSAVDTLKTEGTREDGAPGWLSGGDWIPAMDVTSSETLIRETEQGIFVDSEGMRVKPVKVRKKRIQLSQKSPAKKLAAVHARHKRHGKDARRINAIENEWLQLEAGATLGKGKTAFLDAAKALREEREAADLAAYKRLRKQKNDSQARINKAKKAAQKTPSHK